MNNRLSANHQDYLIAYLSALAIAIHVVEASLPSLLPGAKPGLANVITMIAFIQYGWSCAAWISVIRVIVGSLVIGSFLSPTFLLSLGGAVGSLLILRVLMLIPKTDFSPIGYSIAMAITHMACQFWLAYLFLIPNEGLFYLLPPLMTLALGFGIINGVISRSVLLKLQ